MQNINEDSSQFLSHSPSHRRSVNNSQQILFMMEGGNQTNILSPELFVKQKPTKLRPKLNDA